MELDASHARRGICEICEICEEGRLENATGECLVRTECDAGVIDKKVEYGMDIRIYVSEAVWLGQTRHGI